MSLKPVVVVIPQRTLRFLSTSGIGSAGCPRVLVARRHGGTCRSEVHACTRTLESTNAETENEREREVDGALIEEDDEEMDVAPSRAVKHKSVEQRRKKKISEGIQQLLETLRPASPAGKMTRAEILERAVIKINTLKEENEQLKSKIDALPQTGGEMELYGKLSKLMLEFVSLKSQLQICAEQQQQEEVSRDQRTKSCDLNQAQTVDSSISEEAPCSAQSSLSNVTAPYSSSSTVKERLPDTSHTVTIDTATTSQSRVQAQSNTIVSNVLASDSRDRNTMATVAPPTINETPPTNQPWPVVSILSHGQHTARNRVPTCCHSNGLRTSRGQSSSGVVQNASSSHSLPVSIMSSLEQGSASLQQRSSRIITSPRNVSMTSSSSTTPRNVVNEHFPSSNNFMPCTAHLRSESRLAPPHNHHHLHHHHHHHQHHHHQEPPPQQRQQSLSRELQRECYHSPSAVLPPHTSSIVQPWVESNHQRPRLHHMTKATPRIYSSQYPLHHRQHQQEGQRHDRHGGHSHNERFVPYPSTLGRVNHNMPAFSPSLWSHDHHMTSAGTNSSTIGQNVAPLGGNYASSHDPNHYQYRFTPPLGSSASNLSNFDFSNNYSSGQGHPSSFGQTQSGRSNNMMSNNSTATPPFSIQPHPHSGSNSSTAVWRPYSERSRSSDFCLAERSRSSGFCLADILSLHSETETPPLQLESTPPTGHRGIQSFLVNRLLDDI